jgi:beta-lactamase class A
MRRAYRKIFSQPGTALCTTAAEMARLLRLIWRDEAGPAEACSQLRAILGSQRLTRKIATGFAADVAVAAKSGTVPGVISNDVGTVTYPDGRRCAVAVFTRAVDGDADPHDAARLIGISARKAVEHLRH